MSISISLPVRVFTLINIFVENNYANNDKGRIIQIIVSNSIYEYQLKMIGIFKLIISKYKNAPRPSTPTWTWPTRSQPAISLPTTYISTRLTPPWDWEIG